MKYEINTVLLIVGLSTGTLYTRSNYVFDMLFPVYLIFRVSKIHVIHAYKSTESHENAFRKEKIDDTL